MRPAGHETTQVMTIDVRRLDPEEIETAVGTLDGWQVVDGRLHSEYVFADFVEAMGFMVRAAIWAEQLNHHPDWSNLYKTVRVWLETHDVDGISNYDIQLAAKMNQLAGR
jgi:4a-hydroxytetrahydrobiopterin dehydratase